MTEDAATKTADQQAGYFSDHSAAHAARICFIRPSVSR
jgi:hypothetical protein